MLLRVVGIGILLASIWLDVTPGPDGKFRLERPERIAPVKIELTWDAPRGGAEVAGYEVYRAVEVATTTETVWVDRVLTERPYWYAVRAVGRNGKRSGWSEWICVEVNPP